MIRHLFGRIAALWRPASISTPRGREQAAAAKDTGKMGAFRPAGCARLDAGEGAGPARVSSDDVLACAMGSIGLDFDRLARNDSPWLQEMRATCRSCNARSRCRRDLGTGDFTRRYRHYCANTESFALLAAAEHPRPDRTRIRQEH